ncbi:phage major capsid protein [Granulicella tundricola]|uniref:Phage major capsid protein, HK97 family n=1 Tax=Granulicella tundricola (strain ATCC BAA-1859 / DSM 23138 / MP5ACTX9) TaxID=1198114 RepID=E8X0Q6_GRATM|nr:phage major capsid protein [Granulicella tundricola]ADW69007.1 phage major capsid protein, HK97 family [Granulicella tundricola MP5ACTX9]
MSMPALQEQRNKLMTDAAVILRSDAPTADQIESANKMIADAGELEQRVATLKQVEAYEAEQRAFVPAPRPTGEQSKDEQRTRAVDALRSYMIRDRVEPEYRDLLTTSSASAGVTIPQMFSPVLVQALKDYAPVLDAVNVITTNKNGAPMKMNLINYTGTILPVVAEGTQFPEIDPAFTSQILNVDKLGGEVKISNEMLDDSEFDLGGWLTQAWQNTYGYSLEHYVTAGDGSNIASLLAVAATGTTSAAAGVITYPDIAALYGGLTAAYARNGSFMMSTATRAALMALTATTGQSIFNTDPTNGPFSSIFGRPIYINDSMPTLAAGNKAILFGDFKKAYTLRLDGAPTIKRLDERYADTDEVGFIIRSRVGGITMNAGIAPVIALTVHA